MNIDWKSITPDNIDDLRPISWAYCQALVNLKLWDKFCDSFYDDSLSENIVGALLKSSVRKNILKNMEEAKIIHLLDTVNPLIRRHLLNILIEQADTCPVSIAVGEKLLKNISQHPWGYEFTKEIFSLQSYEALKIAFRARIKPGHAKTPLMLWKYATDPTNSYITKIELANKDNSNDSNSTKRACIHKSNFVYLSNQHFANARQLKKRNNFASFITDLYIEGLESMKKNDNEHIEDDEFFNFVYQPFYNVFVGFQDVWIQNKETYEKVRQALLSFPFHLTKFAPIISFMQNLEVTNSYFNFKYFINHKILTNDDIVFNILPAALEEDFKKPLYQTKFVRYFIRNLQSGYNSRLSNLYRSLQAISLSPKLKEDNNYQKLAFIWPKLLQYYEEYAIDCFDKEDLSPFSNLLNSINVDNVQDLTQPSDTYLFSFDYSMGIINKIIHNTLDSKEAITKNSPSSYQRKISLIFSTMISPSSWRNLNVSNNIQDTPFFKYLDADTRNKILSDFIMDPNGKSISSEISNDSPTTLLSLCLIFDDLKKITQILDRNKDDKSDEYGFVKDISFNFPASLTQKSRKVEEYKGTIHVFEKKIIPLLRHKSESIANNAYNLYISFVEKLFYFAIKINDKNLYKLACKSHFRLCRFLNANTTAENQKFVINKFIERVCNPLSLYVGIKAHETDNSNGCEEYAASVYDNIIVKFPFSTEQSGLTMFPIIVQILLASKHNKLPGIGIAGAIIVEKLINRLFNEIPATFKIPTGYQSNLQYLFSFYTNFNQLEENDQLFNENIIKESQNLLNERAKLVLPDLIVKKFLKNVIAKPSKLDITPRRLNLFVKPSLVNENLFSKRYSAKIKPAFEPFMKLIEILNEKIDTYNPENYDHPTTSLIVQFRDLISSNNFCSNTIQLYHNLPQIVIDQFDSLRSDDSNIITDTESTYLQKLQNFQTHYDLSKETMEFIKALFKNDTNQHFLLELINSESFDYDVLAKIIKFIPLTKQQDIDRKKNVQEIKKPDLHFDINVSYKENKAYQYYLKVKNCKPFEKKKKCQLCGTVLPEKPAKQKQKKGTSLEYGSWENIIAWDIVKPILLLNPQTFCNALKTKGNELFNYIKILYRQLTKNNIDLNMESKTVKLINNGEKGGQFKSIDFNFVSNLLDLCFKDILTVDPEPTKENPNPKPTPTLFSDDKGNISNLLSPFSDSNSRSNAAGSSSSPQLQGDRKFFSTKVLIAYLTSILSLPMTVGHVDLTIFAGSLNEILSMSPADLKNVIGNDNYSYYIDHLASMFITHLSFGKDVKNKEWGKKFESPLFECFFRLFTCDATHHVTLEFVNKRLQSLSNVDEKNAIVSSLVSVLSSTDLNFTLHTRTRTTAWCVDQRYVGSPLPSYCVEYLDMLASDEKCHIDIKKTIAAGIVAIFKSQAIVRANPTSQFNALFGILKKLYTKSKLLMTPFFCQLLTPEFCFSLAKSSNAYASLMPTKSLPEALLTSLPFGLISMPQDERFEDDVTITNEENTPKSWKEAYDIYLSSFIGNSLLMKEENILQLVIQVLTNVQARGGRTAEMISKFINSLLAGPNILKLSPILINFIFSFCLQDPHKELDKLVDSFVSIFTKLRASIDEVNESQCSDFWTNSYNFKRSNYDSINNTCNSFIKSFEYVIDKLRNKADVENAHAISKRIVAEMDGKSHPSLFISSFVILRNLFSFIADDDFIKPLLSLYPSVIEADNSSNNEEENLICLLKFVRKTALLLDKTYYPFIVPKAFQKNINGLTNNVMKEICQWPLEVSRNENVINAISPLIQSYKSLILKPAADSNQITEELKEIMSKLWMFSQMDQSRTPSYNDTNVTYTYKYGTALNQNLRLYKEADILNALKEMKKPKKVPKVVVRRRGRRGRR